MRISDWSSDVCSSDLSAREARAGAVARAENQEQRRVEMGRISGERFECPALLLPERLGFDSADVREAAHESQTLEKLTQDRERIGPVNLVAAQELSGLESEQARSRAESDELRQRSEEHTSELPSPM